MVLDIISFLTCLTSLCNANFWQAEEYTEKKLLLWQNKLVFGRNEFRSKRNLVLASQTFKCGQLFINVNFS